MKPIVVNVRNHTGKCIYVGRRMPGKFAGHPLGNPFKLARNATEEERAMCLKLYRTWLVSLPDYEEQIAALAAEVQRTGLPLGCWCSPKTCHADLLADLIGERVV